jgi:amino acid transporter
VSGSALLVDYVLTIAVSVASAGDAVFSFLPPHWHDYKLVSVLVILGGLTIMNLRGVKESILVLTPIFYFVIRRNTARRAALKAAKKPTTDAVEAH